MYSDVLMNISISVCVLNFKLETGTDPGYFAGVYYYFELNTPPKKKHNNNNNLLSRHNELTSKKKKRKKVITYCRGGGGYNHLQTHYNNTYNKSNPIHWEGEACAHFIPAPPPPWIFQWYVRYWNRMVIFEAMIT